MTTPDAPPPAGDEAVEVALSWADGVTDTWPRQQWTWEQHVATLAAEVRRLRDVLDVHKRALANRDAALRACDAEIAGHPAALAAAEARGFARGIEAAAKRTDCDCPRRDEVLRAVEEGGRNCGKRWTACGDAPCGAIGARDLRALASEAAS